jgi:hypothetical protein
MEFWQVLGDTASVLQVVTVVASVYAAVKLWQQNRRLRALAQNTPPIENFADRFVPASDSSVTPNLAVTCATFAPFANSISATRSFSMICVGVCFLPFMPVSLRVRHPNLCAEY